MCFFKVKHYFGYTSGMVGPIDVKRCFKVKFRNSSISGIVGLIDVKWKGSELIWYWADFMTTHMNLTLEFQGQSLK